MTKISRSDRATAQTPDPASDAGEPDYLDLGRTNQKLRTRDALVNVAAEFIRTHRPVSVAEVADEARVSRTTAYRYFPTSEMLSAQATLRAADVVESGELERNARGPGAPADKLDAVIAGSDTMVSTHEAAFRAMLRFSAEANLATNPKWPRRPTYRRRWLEAALAELKSELGAERFDKLTGALSLMCGIEPVIVLRDICSMSPVEAREVKRWAGQLLLRAALEEAAESRRHKSGSVSAKRVRPPMAAAPE